MNAVELLRSLEGETTARAIAELQGALAAERIDPRHTPDEMALLRERMLRLQAGEKVILLRVKTC